MQLEIFNTNPGRDAFRSLNMQGLAMKNANYWNDEREKCKELISQACFEIFQQKTRNRQLLHTERRLFPFLSSQA